MRKNLKDMQPMELICELYLLGYARGEIAQMAHSIGMDHQKCYVRHKKKFYKPFRNYCSVEENSSDKVLWDKLVEKGYAKARVNKENVYYLTRKGLDYLGEQLNVSIYDAEKF